MSFSSLARSWLPLLPLFGLLGATYWLNLQVQPQPAKPDSSKRHDPDAIIENFSATKLNEQGVPSFIMTAKTMLHFPDDDSTTLDAPRITMLSAEHPPIHARSDHGTVSSRGDDIFLHDKCRSNSRGKRKAGSTCATNRVLAYHPGRELNKN